MLKRHFSRLKMQVINYYNFLSNFLFQFLTKKSHNPNLLHMFIGYPRVTEQWKHLNECSLLLITE